MNYNCRYSIYSSHWCCCFCCFFFLLFSFIALRHNLIYHHHKYRAHSKLLIQTEGNDADINGTRFDIIRRPYQSGTHKTVSNHPLLSLDVNMCELFVFTSLFFDYTLVAFPVCAVFFCFVACINRRQCSYMLVSLFAKFIW